MKARIGRGLYRAVMAARAAVGDRETEVLCTRGGIHWQLDLREAVELAIYVFGAFEPELRHCFARVLKPGMIALDVGANVGSHALYMARLVGPEGRVYALEPTEFAFRKLERNIELNPWTRGIVHASQAFAGDLGTRPPPAVYASWNLEDLATGHRDHAGHLMSATGARAVTVDGFVREQGLTRLDVVKIDVDGYEMRVVRGAVETLARHRPFIVLELCEYTLVETGSNVRELCSALADLAYSFRTIKMRQLPDNVDTIAGLVPPRGIVNVLLTPRDRERCPTTSSTDTTCTESAADSIDGHSSS